MTQEQRAAGSARATTPKLSNLKRAWILSFGMLLVAVVLLVLVARIYTNLIEKGWTIYTRSNSALVSHYVDALAIDEAGRVWAGTSGGGLSVLAPNRNWTSYTSEDLSLVVGKGFGSLTINALAIDEEGRVWAGTAGGGLSVLAPDGSWTTYTPENSGLVDSSVQKLAIDEAGRVWMGIWTFWGYEAYGLSVLALDGSWTSYTSEDSGLVGNVVSALAIDEAGRVWVGTQMKLLDQELVSSGGLSVLAPDGSWTTYTSEDSGLVSDYINALAIDAGGRVWVGTRGGLSVLTPDGSWTTYTSEDLGLVSDYVNALAIDAGGRVWAGTAGGGLSVLAPDGSWTTYTSSNSGLADNSVLALAIDDEGRVWVGAGKSFGGSDGLSRFDERAVTSRSILQTVADVVKILRLASNFAAATFVILSIGWFIERSRRPI